MIKVPQGNGGGVTCVAPLPKGATWASVAATTHSRLLAGVIFDLRVRMPRHSVSVVNWSKGTAENKKEAMQGEFRVDPHIWIWSYTWPSSFPLPRIFQSYLFAPMDDGVRGIPFRFCGNVLKEGRVCWGYVPSFCGGHWGYPKSVEKSPLMACSNFWASGFSTTGSHRRLTLEEMRKRQRAVFLVARKGVSPADERIFSSENPPRDGEVGPPVGRKGDHILLVKKPTGVFFTTNKKFLEVLGGPIPLPTLFHHSREFSVLLVMDTEGNDALILSKGGRERFRYNVDGTIQKIGRRNHATACV